MKTVKCGLCGGVARVLFSRYPGYQEPHTFDLAQCPWCRTGIAVQPEEMDTAPIYTAIYKQGADIVGYERYFRYAEAVGRTSDPLAFLASQEIPYRGVLEAVRELSEQAQILEVGCGLGYLTFALNIAGYHARGIDIDPGAVSAAIERYGPWYACQRIEDHEGFYDLVVLTEVLEHVPDPIAFLRACGRCLKRGGAIVLSVPNRDAFGPYAIWDSELPPVHLWWYSRDSFRCIARILGLSLDFVTCDGGWHVTDTPRDPWTARAAAVPRLDAAGRVKARPLGKRKLWRGLMRRFYPLVYRRPRGVPPVESDTLRDDFAVPQLVVRLRNAPSLSPPLEDVSTARISHV